MSQNNSTFSNQNEKVGTAEHTKDTVSVKEENIKSEIIENNPVDLKEEIESTLPVEQENVIGEDEVESDPYAYLERGEFSSEKFKIEIKNLPKFYGFGEFRKLLNEKLKLNANKIKTPKRNSPYSFACFRNEEDRANAIQVVNNSKWKGNQLSAIKAKPAPDPLVKKRKQDEDDKNANKKTKTDDRTQEEKLKASTIPFWDTPYEKQLEMKQEEVSQILKRIGNQLYYQNSEIRNWLNNQKRKYNNLPCELLEIRSTEQLDGYRNKCEFTVGMDEETKLPTVGFRIGSYVSGIVGVGPVDNLKHIPEPMKKACKVFQEFVRSSDLQVFNPEVQTGHFRQLTLRSAPNQLMAVVGIHPQNLTPEQLLKFKEDLSNFFSESSGKEAGVTSLYYQSIVKKQTGGDSTPPEHLWGQTHIYETILGLKFRISPEAFFQINTKGAEILYKSAIELADPSENSTVLDVCCGTGTIGLCFSGKCKQVLGLELVPQAIVDAKENAEINNIRNSEFFAGKAEDILGKVCYHSNSDDLIAIVDPPRAGLHHKAVLQLRKINKINKLVYISCNPNSAFKNFIDLGRPESKTLHGEPFVPIKAVAVDLFPHTKHCELIIYFERWDKVVKEVEDQSSESNTLIVDNNNI